MKSKLFTSVCRLLLFVVCLSSANLLAGPPDPPPSPPTTFVGQLKQCGKSIYLVLTWQTPVGDNVLAYNIYDGNTVIAELPPYFLVYEILNLSGINLNAIEITAVYLNGLESDKVPVVLGCPSHC